MQRNTRQFYECDHQSLLSNADSDRRITSSDGFQGLEVPVDSLDTLVIVMRLIHDQEPDFGWFTADRDLAVCGSILRTI